MGDVGPLEVVKGDQAPDASPEPSVMVAAFPHLLALGDRQTSDRGFRHCPILGEGLTTHRDMIL